MLKEGGVRLLYCSKQYLGPLMKRRRGAMLMTLDDAARHFGQIFPIQILYFLPLAFLLSLLSLIIINVIITDLNIVIIIFNIIISFTFSVRRTIIIITLISYFCYLIAVKITSIIIIIIISPSLLSRPIPLSLLLLSSSSLSQVSVSEI